MEPRFVVRNRSITPTDLAQYLRLDRCEQYLRLRLFERSEGRRFFGENGINLQSIPPLLTRSGARYESDIVQSIRDRHRSVRFDVPSRPSNDNASVLDHIRAIAPGETLVIVQPRLEADLNGWTVRGDLDLLRLSRDPSGERRIMIADIKSSAAVKVEHRIQVALYGAVLGALLETETAPLRDIRTDLGLLYRGPLSPDESLAEKHALERRNMERLFGIETGLLEVLSDADRDAYAMAVEDLLTGPDSAAERAASNPFERLFYGLSYKCDGCLYNEFCMKDAHERDDLSLIPYLSDRDKKALRSTGIETVPQLAGLKSAVDGASDLSELVPTPESELFLARLAATSAGPRIDELIHRSRSVLRSRGEAVRSIYRIPGKGHPSLPHSAPDFHPNLVEVYIDAQHDYLHDRIYLLGARIVAREGGEIKGSRSVVHLTDGPPDTPEKEERIFADWVFGTLRAVTQLAAPDDEGERRAPIHLVFWNGFDQRLLLEGLGRNFHAMAAAVPAFYDFVTQIAAYESPVVSFLDGEIREHRNFPMVCPSLQAVARYLKLDWNEGERYADLFRERLFDWTGRDGDVFYTRRSRFNSQIPLEYAYAAWDDLQRPETGAEDDYAAYRRATPELLIGFQSRRLEAIERVASALPRNRLAQKTPFHLPDLHEFEEVAPTLAHALNEFVAIERHAALGNWRTIRNLPPERRVLMGETWLVRYREGDQPPDVVERNRENLRRYALRNEIKREGVELTKDRKADTKWSQTGTRFRLRLETAGIDGDLDTILRLSGFEAGDSFILYPRTVVDERLPEAERTRNQPTPKQMLYGTRFRLAALETEKDAAGSPVSAIVEGEIERSMGGSWSKGFVFPAHGERPLEPDALYTLDPCPNDWMGYFCLQVVEGLCAMEDGTGTGRNTLYDRLADRSSEPDASPSILAGQARFLEGLDALHRMGALHGFESEKREFIGEHGDDPILLVQGPPGTGKSYSTAFAILARLQGALAAGRDYRVVLSCKTHAATDVLLRAVVDALGTLSKRRESHPDLWNRHFDDRLLTTPLFRIIPRQAVPEGVVGIPKDSDRLKGTPKCMDRVTAESRCICAATPGGVYRAVKDRWDKDLFGHPVADLLVLDEASQMSLPEAMMAALPLRPSGSLVVVGDPRQMPPIVQHDWIREARRTFRSFRSYESLYESLLALNPPMIRFRESFRLHAAMAEFLRREIYSQDGIDFHSKRTDQLAPKDLDDAFLAAVLSPEHPIVVIVHDEEESQTRNAFEQALMTPILRTLADAGVYGLDPRTGLGVVVPHRAQRAAFRASVPELTYVDPADGREIGAVDTVERFQGDEREVILVGATESDREYLQASGEFLYNPKRLTVALSRGKKKIILVASKSVFTLFSDDEELFRHCQIWKNLLRRTCSERLWNDRIEGYRVAVWGCRHPSRGDVSFE